MKKLLKLSFVLICVFSLTVWSCKPTETVTKAETPVKTNKPAELKRNEKVQLPKFKLGDCTYDRRIDGIATITMFDPSNPGESIITFSFEPSREYSSVLSAEYKTKQTFNVEGVGQYPPKEWAINKNLLQGETFPCVRYENNAGIEQGKDCYPVKYDFPQFKNDNWKN